MTTKFRVGHARRLAVALTAFGLIASGCGVQGNSAATVDGVEITQETLGALTDASLSSAGSADRSAVNRDELTGLIRLQLLQDLAAERGVTADPAQLEALTGGAPLADVAAQLGVPEDRVQLLLQIANDTIAQPWEGDLVTVTLDLVQVADRQDGEKLRADLAGPRAAEALAARPEKQEGVVFDNTDPQTAGLARFGVFTAAVGQTMVLESGAEVVVVRVVDRTSVRGTADLSPFAQVQYGLALVEPLILAEQASSQDISVNPRFGRWDPVAVAVVA